MFLLFDRLIYIFHCFKHLFDPKLAINTTAHLKICVYKNTVTPKNSDPYIHFVQYEHKIPRYVFTLDINIRSMNACKSIRGIKHTFKEMMVYY